MKTNYFCTCGKKIWKGFLPVHQNQVHMLTTHIQNSLLVMLDTYTIECTQHKYDCSKPCLTLLASCILDAVDNYITTRVNVTTN
jgi:hypothetical protein